jgi:hypothetical protein
VLCGEIEDLFGEGAAATDAKHYQERDLKRAVERGNHEQNF